MASPTYRWLFWCLALVGLVLDQGSKYGVFHWLYNPAAGGEQEVVPGAFRLVTQFQAEPDPDPDGPWLRRLQTVSGEAMPKVNRGALFGLGGEYKHLANGLFAVVSVIAAAA